MNKKSDKLPHKDWSPLLRRVALDESQRPSRDAIKNLTDKDVKILRDIASQKQAAPEIRQDKILAVLSEYAPDLETAKVYDNILKDKDRPVLLRAISAISLAHIPTAISEDILIAHIADKNASVAQRAIQSLGKVGSKKGLQKLNAMNPPENNYVLQQWVFSKLLIQHRLGLTSDEPPLIAGTTWPAEDARKPQALPMENIPVKRLETITAELHSELFGMDLAKDRGFHFETDRSLQYLLITQPLTTKDGIKHLDEIPMIVGIIAMWDERTNKPILDQIILTTPLAKGVLVQGYRQDGTLLFEGSGNVIKSVANFTLVNIARSSQCKYKITGELKPEKFIASAEMIPRLKTRRTQKLFSE